LSLTTNQAKDCQKDNRKFHLQGDHKGTHLISNITFITPSSFNSGSFAILHLWTTQYALFYFLKYSDAQHTDNWTNLFPSSQYSIIKIMASQLSHETDCVIPHQWLLCSSCGMLSLLFIFFPFSVLFPQAFCVIRIADFLIVSLWTLHLRAFHAISYCDQSHVTIPK
jgi:hypothetical protein